MTHTSQFHITLPSNSSINYFPNNRPNDYTTQLAKPIRLEGEWEVALMDVQYKYDIKYLPTETTLGIYIAAGEVEQKDLLDVVNGRVEDPGSVMEWKIAIPAGEYATVDTLLTKVNDTIKAGVTADIYNVMPKFTYDDGKRRVRYQIRASSATHHYYITLAAGHLANQLGLEGDSVEIGNQKLLVELSEATGVFTDPPLYDRYQTLFVYTDIIKPQLVGDVEAPLLAVVPINDLKGRSSYWAPPTPYFLPLERRIFDTLNIGVFTETGKPFPFNNTGHVIIRLLFRRTHMLL